MRERPLSAVPKIALLLLAMGLAAQLGSHFSQAPARALAENLPTPPALPVLQLASFGEPIGLSKLLLLYLQTFDDQPGVTAAFRQIDYNRMQTWLDLTLTLDPPAEYPLFLASRVYGAVGDQGRQRKMFEFVYQQFFADPNRRWESLAFAALMTKHHLNDLHQAQKYAQALREYATGTNVPDWAKQMDIFMLEDMKEYDRALALLSALLRSGQITDSTDLRFLQKRADQIKSKVNAP